MYRHQYLKWSDLLELMIEARTGQSSVRVLNRGFAGDKTYPDPAAGTPGAIHRFQADVIDTSPDIVVLLIGGNDEKSTDEARRVTRENLNSMVHTLCCSGTNVLLLQYAVLPNPESPASAWTHLAANNQLIEEVARTQTVPTLPLQPYFDEAIRTNAHRELVNPIDGVHLAPGGEVLVARAVFRAFVDRGWI